MTPTKNPLTSKTLWVNFLIAASAFYPPVATWFQAHPTETVAGLGVVNMILRAVTHGKLGFSDD